MRVAAVNLERGGKVKKKIDPAAEKPKLVCGNEKMASIGYAWSFLEGSEPRYITALEIPPVDSPQTAVRAAIASKAQT